MEKLCRKEDCGGPESAFDEDGCCRPNCEKTECEVGQECRDARYAPVVFNGPLEDGTCEVGWQGVDMRTKMCFPVAGE